MKLRSRFLQLAVASALTLTACATPEDDADVSAGGVDTEETASETETTEETDDTTGAVEIAVASDDLGDHLVDGEGNALYVSIDDEDGLSNCGLECARIWQPVEGEATVSGDLDASLLDTTERGGEVTQVTYNGAPLYRFVADEAGDARGHGVNGTWFVVGPDGTPVTEGGLQAPAEDAPSDEAIEDDTTDEDA